VTRRELVLTGPHGGGAGPLCQPARFLALLEASLVAPRRALERVCAARPIGQAGSENGPRIKARAGCNHATSFIVRQRNVVANI
jgi:hypothetical protein